MQRQLSYHEMLARIAERFQKPRASSYTLCPWCFLLDGTYIWDDATQSVLCVQCHGFIQARRRLLADGHRREVLQNEPKVVDMRT